MFDRYHIETTRGKIGVPSVTEIIGFVAPRVWRCSQVALDNGSKLHAACAMNLRGRLDWASIAKGEGGPALTAKVKSQEKFMAAFGYTRQSVKHVELRIVHPDLRFGGTFDCYMADDTLIDWKSSGDPRTIIQLGGYSILAKQVGLKPKKLMEVELTEKRFVAVQVEMRQAENLFLSFRSVFSWMEKHNIGEKAA